MREGEINPQVLIASAQAGARPPVSVWGNDLFQCSVYQIGEEELENSMLHLSIKRHDREAVHDWRHLQAIKNEVVGRERYAVEIYPPESKLVDTANQYHLWVFPAGFELPFGFDEQFVSSDLQVADFNARREAGEHKGRQRPFQDGLPVAEMRNLDANAHRSMMQRPDVNMRMKVPDTSKPRWPRRGKAA